MINGLDWEYWHGFLWSYFFLGGGGTLKEMSNAVSADIVKKKLASGWLSFSPCSYSQSGRMFFSVQFCSVVVQCSNIECLNYIKFIDQTQCLVPRSLSQTCTRTAASFLQGKSESSPPSDFSLGLRFFLFANLHDSAQLTFCLKGIHAHVSVRV